LLALLGGGGLAGVLVAGFAADRLIENGRVNGRILIGGASLVLAALFSLLALLSRTLIVAIPLFVVGSAAFAARDPALDAARLDIMHHRLWGRAEAVRTLLRRLMVASAPIVFGSLADALSSSRTSGNGQHGFGASASAGGLHITFLVLLGTLAAGGLITFRATRTYPQDVATAVASEEATAASSRHGRPGPSGDEQRPTAGGQVVSYRSRSVSRRVSSAE
jgi:MFS family permease